MEWSEIIMDAMWGFAGSIIGVIGALGFSIWSDKKGYNNVSEKIGQLNNTTLSGQHNEMSGLIKGVQENVKNTIAERTKLTDRYSLEINSKVDQITNIIQKNEGRYENLNLDQREVRNNVNKLVVNWETLIQDNKELKVLIMDLKKENEHLKFILKEQNEQLRNQEKQECQNDWDMEI